MVKLRSTSLSVLLPLSLLGASVALFVACGESSTDDANAQTPGSGTEGGSGGQMMLGSTGGSAGNLAAGGAAEPPGGGSPTTGGTGGGSPAAGGASVGGGSTGGASTGGAGGIAAGGNGGAEPGSFNPCPMNGDPCRVMPLGDSITSGAGSSLRAGYRPALFQLSLDNNKKLVFVGSFQNGPDMVGGQPFPKDSEGHSGWVIDDGADRMGLYPEIAGWLNAHPPHIITLMIGTNDVNLEYDLSNAGTRLELLVDRIIENAPDALIVLAQIVPTTNADNNQRTMAFNATIPDIVQSRADDGKHIIMVDMWAAFTNDPNYQDTIMADKLHPNDAGYAVMAGVWWDAISELLPE